MRRFLSPEDMLASGVPEPKMTESDIANLISLVREHDRIWLVYSQNWYTDPMDLILQTLVSKLNLARERDVYGGQV